jgi:hypothetical protein
MSMFSNHPPSIWQFYSKYANDIREYLAEGIVYAFRTAGNSIRNSITNTNNIHVMMLTIMR